VFDVHHIEQHPRSRTLVTYAGHRRADLESVWGSSRSRPARERRV